MEPTSAYAPEANGIAERYNLRLLDMARPMLADSGDARRGLKPLGERFAGDAIMYANDLHNAMPASGAQVGCTPSEGFLGRAVALDVFQRFGCRVWVNTPGKPIVHRPKFTPCARPGRFLGLERPMGSGVFRVLTDSGQMTQSQSVVFADTPKPPVPAPPLPAPLPVPPPPGMRVRQQILDDDDSDDEVDLRPAASPPVPPLAPGLSVQQTSGSDDGSADEVILHSVAIQAPAGQALPCAGTSRASTSSWARPRRYTRSTCWPTSASLEERKPEVRLFGMETPDAR
jgi:hypothetical protein